MHEKQVEAKYVESLLLPRLDAGSTPASSTGVCKTLNIPAGYSTGGCASYEICCQTIIT